MQQSYAKPRSTARYSTLRLLQTLVFACCVWAGTAEAADTTEAAAPPRNNPAYLADASRNSGYNDFLRAVWVPHGVPVKTLTLGKRAFFTATSFFKPQIGVEGFLNFIGNYYQDSKDLALMRCRPSEAQMPKLEPLLATWPNTFGAIAADLAGPEGHCASPELTPGEKLICDLAIQYQDPPQTVYSEGLAQALLLAAQMYATPEGTEALRKDYGIFPAFSGLGFAVQASASPSGEIAPMTTADILRNAVVPEYLLSNALLEEAGCRCIQVPDYAKRRTAPIDPAYIWSRGKLNEGACRTVRKLAALAG